jgi:hypothetical protein
MRFSSDFWLACRAGAAVESGRMFPDFLSARSGALCRILPTLNQFFAVGPLLQMLLQTVGVLLAFELLLGGLERSGGLDGLHVSDAMLR